MNQPPIPPTADVRPYPITTHNHTRVDNYYWLREKTNPDVLAHLAAENAYTQAMMAHTKPLQEQLYQELVGRIQETDQTAPVKRGDYVYYSRTEAGKQYAIHCRQKVGADVEEVLLDLNQMAAEHGYDYLVLGVYHVSPNQNLLAYALDTDGAENFVVYFKDLTTGDLLPDQITRVSYSAEWANDSATFFYTRQDEAKRSAYLYRHTLGADPADDPLIYAETDELYRVGIGKTRDKRYLLLGLGSIETTEYRLLDADAPLSDFVMVHPREKGLRYDVAGHRDGTLYLVTNADGATNSKVVTTLAATPGRAHWQDLIPHRADVKVDDVDVFNDFMAVYQRENGLKTLRITAFDSGETHTITFPDPVYSYTQSANPEFASDTLRFTYSSLTTADSDIDYNMRTRSWAVVKQVPILGGYDPANYQSERIWATAVDGTKIPISLVYRKGMQRDGNNLCHLYAYGSYGYSTEPTFRRDLLSLIDRGFIFAIAHIRGGQEMGRQWYEQGKYLHKKNTFTDFIACGRHLIAEGYTRREKLVISGRSAGGLLMGAVLNMAPDLADTAVAGVPFVDVVTTMLDETIPLTVPEFEEWGNPKNKEYYDYMLSYSPYDNVEANAYPNILVTAGLNDPRVAYWEPAKWIAKLRTLKTDDNHLFFKIFMGAGHFSSSGRYDHLKDTAFEYAFILDTLKITA
ncbi:MAG: S9 family peptidase [Ardenticatenaceae bacterium]|nr:S9 family peptidase [Ardenticatenaceae bacterium]MCB8990339.1 S9 family peptidase [Ardenticatenaceae bacterium]MCB9005232.1 S9 family peptidase [Ardenticatenaceae bacterium]